MPFVAEFDREERRAGAWNRVGVRKSCGVKGDRERLVVNRLAMIDFRIRPFDEHAEIRLRVRVLGQVVLVIVPHDGKRRAAADVPPHDFAVKLASREASNRSQR